MRPIHFSSNAWTGPGLPPGSARNETVAVVLPGNAAPETAPKPSEEAKARRPKTGLIGRSKQMKALRREVRRWARFPWPVLIEGETGTGKELVANALHKLSKRQATGDLVSVNCSQFHNGTLDSHLFGHRKGAFTDAKVDRPGVISEAKNGSLFLDEVQSAAPDLQGRLLRVLENGTYRPVGANNDEVSTARIIAATNKAPEELIEKGILAEDLFHRFTARIQIPPLRERREDIRPLAHHLLRKSILASKEMAELGIREIRITKRAIKKLTLGHDWPGNVRELRNVLTRAATQAIPMSVLEQGSPENGVRIRIRAKEIKLPKDATGNSSATVSQQQHRASESVPLPGTHTDKSTASQPIAPVANKPDLARPFDGNEWHTISTTPEFRTLKETIPGNRIIQDRSWKAFFLTQLIRAIEGGSERSARARVGISNITYTDLKSRTQSNPEQLLAVLNRVSELRGLPVLALNQDIAPKSPFTSQAQSDGIISGKRAAGNMFTEPSELVHQRKSDDSGVQVPDKPLLH